MDNAAPTKSLNNAHRNQRIVQSSLPQRTHNCFSLVDNRHKQPSGTAPFELKGKVKSFSYIRHLKEGNQQVFGYKIGRWRLSEFQARKLGIQLFDGLHLYIQVRRSNLWSNNLEIIRAIFDNNRKYGDMRNNHVWQEKVPNVIQQINWFYEQRDLLSQQTGIPHHVDHIHPVNHPNLCGLTVNTLANLRGFNACRNVMNTSQRSKFGKNLS
ncbi:hypothetical protein [Nostoc sp. MS1]|uniref:hypothetical protein n=1 Tax=Nostoc sp. MS1 TaxID=2764711 RepID=UPI001CC3C7DF|nr:hypothetical protein [Nostoc sp. MS1]BCL39748.1 hypothetical protein NSMS1_61950 [Nostoc sp. MS1]